MLSKMHGTGGAKIFVPLLSKTKCFKSKHFLSTFQCFKKCCKEACNKVASEEYSEPCQTSKTKLIPKIVNS